MITPSNPGSKSKVNKINKVINKPLKSRIVLRIRALITKRTGIVGNDDEKQRLEYADICKNIKKKARVDIRKYNRDTI